VQSNKPIMEKRRRARLNHCLNELIALILVAMKKDVSYNPITSLHYVSATMSCSEKPHIFHIFPAFLFTEPVCIALPVSKFFPDHVTRFHAVRMNKIHPASKSCSSSKTLTTSTHAFSVSVHDKTAKQKPVTSKFCQHYF
jgi:hypothetical protein